jgi:hypothetical protein
VLLEFSVFSRTDLFDLISVLLFLRLTLVAIPLFHLLMLFEQAINLRLVVLKHLVTLF